MELEIPAAGRFSAAAVLSAVVSRYLIVIVLFFFFLKLANTIKIAQRVGKASLVNPIG